MSDRLDEGNERRPRSRPRCSRATASPKTSPSRDATRSPSGDTARRLLSRERFSAGEAVSSSSTTSRTASRTGQYEIPSPYGRHRPRATTAPGGADETNSCTRRDFPTPGPPRMVKSWHDRSPSACSNASWSRRSSRLRPTIGASKRDDCTAPDRLDRREMRVAVDDLRLDHVSRDAQRPYVEQDVAWRCALLQPDGRSNGLSHRMRRAVDASGHHFAGCDTGPEPERRAPGVHELAVDRVQSIPDLGRCADRAHRVVFVGRGNTEHRGHGTAQRALDGRTMRFENGNELLVPPGSEPAGRTRDRDRSRKRRDRPRRRLPSCVSRGAASESRA